MAATQLVRPRTRGLLKRPGMPVGTVTSLQPRGMYMVWPFADIGFSELVRGVKPTGLSTGTYPPTLGISPYGHGLSLGPLDSTGYLGYPIYWPSLSTPFSFEILLYVGASSIGGANIAALNSAVTPQASQNYMAAIGGSSNTVVAYINNANEVGPSAAIAANTLLHICVTCSSGSQILYVQGAAAGSTEANTFPFTASSDVAAIFGTTATGNNAPGPAVYLHASLATVQWSATEVAYRATHPYEYLVYGSDLIYSSGRSYYARSQDYRLPVATGLGLTTDQRDPVASGSGSSSGGGGGGFAGGGQPWQQTSWLAWRPWYCAWGSLNL